MSQRSEKLHRQVAQLRADVDALQVAWLAQQHCDAVELEASAERARQAHRRARAAQESARAWKLNAILTPDPRRPDRRRGVGDLGQSSHHGGTYHPADGSPPYQRWAAAWG